jgi:hypothetical protein
MTRFLAAVAVLFVLIGGPAHAIEEPRYTVSLKAGNLEVRDYPVLLSAQVTVTGERNEAVSTGFRLLASYIFGGNARKQSISMTAPVVQTRTGGRFLPMTAPPAPGARPASWVVSFIMPSGFTLASLPAPQDGRVRLGALPAARVAVARFSGLAGDADIRRETGFLETFMARNHLRPVGGPSLARYDPPWIPWFLRRNEIWIPVTTAG